MITFKFRLTPEEYFEYNYYTAWAAPARKRYRTLYFLRVILLYGGVALLYILGTDSSFIWIDIAVFAGTGLLYLLFIPFFVRLSVKKRVKDILSRKENQHVLEDAEISISEEGIVDKDTVSESRYSWEGIVQHAETPTCHYLYTNSHHAIVIPKRVIRSDEEQEETEKLLNRHLPLQAL